MDRERFVKDVSERIEKGRCELFVGSGISRKSGFPSWYELLSPFAKEIGITIGKTDDLPLIAQYIENQIGSTELRKRIRSLFGENKETNEYHEAISSLNVDTIWTTNYDCLLESCFSNRKPRVILKNDDLIGDSQDYEVDIIKLHGCACKGDKIVLTKGEYDDFLFGREAIAQRLSNSLIQKSILFLGYGYRDPNIQSIVSQTNHLIEKHKLNHYMIVRKSDVDNLFSCWLEELKRLGIETLVVDSDEQICQVLNEIELDSRGKSIFVSGSHEIKGLTEPIFDLGQKLAEKGLRLINGQSTGIGLTVLQAFMQKCMAIPKDITPFIRFFPNPYAANPDYAEKPEYLTELSNFRSNLFAHTRLAVFFKGGMGTETEFKVALEKRCDVLIGITDVADYENDVIKTITSNDTVMKRIENSDSEYANKLKNRKVPSTDELMCAIEKMISYEK